MVDRVEDLLKAIAQALSNCAPPGWEKAWVTAKVGSDYAEATYDYKDKSGKLNWFDASDSAHDAIAMALMKMRSIMSSAGQEKWNRVKFSLDRGGKFHVDYSYDKADDVSNDPG